MMMRRIEPAGWCAIAGDVIALAAFLVSGVVAVHDGVDSGALIIGVPPLAVAVVATIGLAAASRWRVRWPLVGAIIICSLAALLAMVSFITPLLAIATPVCGLLLAASAMRLDRLGSAAGSG